MMEEQKGRETTATKQKLPNVFTEWTHRGWRYEGLGKTGYLYGLEKDASLNELTDIVKETLLTKEIDVPCPNCDGEYWLYTRVYVDGKDRETREACPCCNADESNR